MARDRCSVFVGYVTSTGTKHGQPNRGYSRPAPAMMPGESPWDKADLTCDA
jgi:hypothetical protein